MAQQQQVIKKLDPTASLLSEVVADSTTLSKAETILRSYVNGLTEEEAKEWRATAVARARRIMSVAEGFSQLLTVISAGQ